VEYSVITIKWARFLPSLVIILLLAACGGNSSGQSSQSAPASLRPAPTMPAARFTPVSSQVFTGTVSSSTVSTSTVETVSDSDQPTATPAAVAGPDLSRGATVYENRCASCHGDQGQGVADKGSDITDFELSLSEFDTLLRTGANGRLGPDHLFGPSAISRSGMEVLHAYVQSLAD
jgi:mono/diheme cytochrome c family protein